MFDINRPYEITACSGMKVSNRIMCDYIMPVTITQGDTTYHAEIGFVGRDKTKSKGEYLFIDNKVHHAPGCDYLNAFFDLDNTVNAFELKWLNF